MSVAEKRQPVLPVQATAPAEKVAAESLRPASSNRLPRDFEFVRWDIWKDQILPYGETDIARTEGIGYVCDGMHLLRAEPPDGNADADIREAGLALRMHSEMSVLIDSRAQFAFRKWKAHQREGQSVLGLFEKLLDAPAVDQIFQSRFFAICPIAVVGEHTIMAAATATVWPGVSRMPQSLANCR